MKKFQFSLSKLMEVKEQQLKQEKERLSELKKIQITLEEEKEELLIKYQRCNQDFNERMMRGGLTVPDIQAAKTYLTRLRDEGKELDQKIALAAGNVEKQVTVVANTTMDLKVVEKLKEKKVEEYNKQIQKDEELFIEEYINTLKHMKEE